MFDNVYYAHLGLPRKRPKKKRLGQALHPGKHDYHGSGKKKDSAFASQKALEGIKYRSSEASAVKTSDMGQSLKHDFTKVQQKFLEEVTKHEFLVNSFYLTGGTALSACYLNHRFSEDIDLFTPKKFDPTTVIASMAQISETLNAKATLTTFEQRLRYGLMFPDKELLKIDFVSYYFDHLEPTNFLGKLAVDSIEDISVNKLLSISQRTASKDFVDLYFILKKYTIWDLRHGVEHKFKLELEPFYLSSLFAKAAELTDLPIMKKKLSLPELQKFFLGEAKHLASKMVKP